MIDINITRQHNNIRIPIYEHNGDSGFDLRCDFDTTFKDGVLIGKECVAIPDTKEIHLFGGGRVLIKTGLNVSIPKGYEMQIRGKSGLALKHGISIVQGIGTIDSNYRGDIGVLLMNNTNTTFIIKDGDKVAQGVICPVEEANFILVSDLDVTSRGTGGFGSTGN